MRPSLLGFAGMVVLAATAVAAAAGPSGSGAAVLRPYLDLSGSEWRALEAAGDLQFDPQAANYRIYWLTAEGKRDFWIFEPASKLEVSVDAEVTRDASGAYVYRYTVTNSGTSQQNLDWFVVRHDGAEVYDVVQPPQGWAFYSQVSLAGVPESVAAWSGRLSPSATAADVPGIPPGQASQTFGFTSRQPPGQVSCYARGWVRDPSFLAPGAREAAAPDPRPKLLGDCVVGVTAGPVPPSAATLSEGYVVLGYAGGVPPGTTKVAAQSGRRSLSFTVGSQEALVDGHPTTLSRPTRADASGHLLVSADLVDLLKPLSASAP